MRFLVFAILMYCFCLLLLNNFEFLSAVFLEAGRQLSCKIA